MECDKCSQIFCEKEIRQWQAKGSNECPLCKQQCQIRAVSLVLRGLIEATKLKGCSVIGCNKAEEKITYEGLVKHIAKECDMVEVRCLYSCGAEFKRIDSRTHFTAGCVGAMIACEACGYSDRRKQMEPHLKCF